METLILLTGTSRFDNLIYLCKSIQLEYPKYKDVFNLKWLICKDQYNGKGNIKKFTKYVNNTDIDYRIMNSGKPNQSNYGGDLFNEPLDLYIKEQNLDNAWIYVYDDDNIIHPRLFEIFVKCMDNNFYGNKEIITTINRWDCGHSREIDNDSFLQVDRNNFIREWFMVDPSAVILKYNIIEKYGGFGNELLYDFNWLNKEVLCGEHSQNNIIWFNEYDNSFGRHLVGSYHDGLILSHDLDDYLDYDTMNMEVTIYDSSVNLPKMIPVLSTKTKEKILQLIKKDIKNFEK